MCLENAFHGNFKTPLKSNSSLTSARSSAALLLRGVVPIGVFHGHGSDGHALVLRGLVEAHGLAVEHAACKDIGIMILDPASHIGQLRKADGMALWKTVTVKTLELVEMRFA